MIDKDVFLLPGQVFCPNIINHGNIMDVLEYQFTLYEQIYFRVKINFLKLHCEKFTQNFAHFLEDAICNAN